MGNTYTKGDTVQYLGQKCEVTRVDETGSLDLQEVGAETPRWFYNIEPSKLDSTPAAEQPAAEASAETSSTETEATE